MLAMEELTQPICEQIGGRPACPNCGRSMHLTRIAPRASGLPDLKTYNCGECGVWLTAAAPSASA
jgi:hypothetical protein